MPNKQIENMESDQLQVQIYGISNQYSPAMNQGNLSITGTPLISTISPLSVSGIYNAQVTILNSILPISIPVQISMSPLNNFSITGSIGLTGFVTLAHTSTQINQNIAYTAPALGSTTINTTPIDVSPYRNYSFYYRDSGGNLTSATLQIAPLTNSPFINAGTGAANTGIVSTTQFLRYSRVSARLSGGVLGTSGTVNFIFQAQI